MLVGTSLSAAEVLGGSPVQVLDRHVQGFYVGEQRSQKIVVSTGEVITNRHSGPRLKNTAALGNDLSNTIRSQILQLSRVEKVFGL